MYHEAKIPVSQGKVHSGTTIISRTSVPFSRFQDEAMAIDQRAGFCYSMNLPAARIWELIPGPTPVNDVCASLCREFAVDRQTCLEDVLQFLDTMQEAGLIQLSDAAPG